MPCRRTAELIGFQRWVIGAYDKSFTWQEWTAAKYRPERLNAPPKELLDTRAIALARAEEGVNVGGD